MKTYTIRKIAMNHTGDDSRTIDIETMRTFDWTGRKEIVLVDEEMVMSFAELYQAIERSALAAPEIVIMPPMAGGC